MGIVASGVFDVLKPGRSTTFHVKQAGREADGDLITDGELAGVTFAHLPSLGVETGVVPRTVTPGRIRWGHPPFSHAANALGSLPPVSRTSSNARVAAQSRDPGAPNSCDLGPRLSSAPSKRRCAASGTRGTVKRGTTVSR